MAPLIGGQVGSLFAASPEEQAAEAPPVFVVRSASPAHLHRFLGRVADRLGAEIAPEILPFLLLGISSAPAPGDFSEEENVGLVVVERERELVPVWIARFGAEDRYRDLLVEAGFQLSELDGWNFAVSREDEFRGLETNGQEWIERVRRERRYPVEAEIDGAELAKLMRQRSDAILQRVTGMPEGLHFLIEDLVAMWRRLIGVAAREIEAFRSIRIGVESGEDTLSLHLGLEAVEDSPLWTLLSERHVAGPPDLAGWLEAEGVALYYGTTDWAGLRDYLQPILAEFEDSSLAGDSVRALQGILSHRAKAGRIRSAGIYDVVDDDFPSLQLSEHRMSEAGLMEYLQAQADWLKHFSDGEEVLLESLDSVGEHPVYTVGVRPEEEGAFWGFYFMMIGDYVLSGDNRERFFRTAERLAMGTKARSPAADYFFGREDAAHVVVFRIEPLVEHLQFFLGKGSVEAVAGLPAPAAELRIGGGAAEGRIEIPLPLLAELYRQVRAVMDVVSEESIEFDVPE